MLDCRYHTAFQMSVSIDVLIYIANIIAMMTTHYSRKLLHLICKYLIRFLI